MLLSMLGTQIPRAEVRDDLTVALLPRFQAYTSVAGRHGMFENVISRSTLSAISSYPKELTLPVLVKIGI